MGNLSERPSEKKRWTGLIEPVVDSALRPWVSFNFSGLAFSISAGKRVELLSYGRNEWKDLKGSWLIMKRETGEDRAKAFLRRKFGKLLYNIEPGIGATWGLPDSFVNMAKSRVVFIECKEALSDASFSYKLRPSQARVIPRMRREGATVLVLVGKPTHNGRFVLWDNNDQERSVFDDDPQAELFALFELIIKEQERAKRQAAKKAQEGS